MNYAIGPRQTGYTLHFAKGTQIYHKYFDNEISYMPADEFLEEEYAHKELDWDGEYCSVNNEGGAYAKYLKTKDAYKKTYNSKEDEISMLLGKVTKTTNPITITIICIVIVSIAAFIFYKHKQK